MSKFLSRRNLIRGALAVPLAASATGAFGSGRARAGDSAGAPNEATSLRGRLFKTLKIGMVKDGGTLAEKFAIAAGAGFDGIELNAPSFNVEEVREAIRVTNLPVDGTVCADHWNVRHSDPDEAVRRKALDSLLGAIRDTHAIGGHSVLLVVGRGSDGTEQEVWQRSVANISQAIPLAAKLGVGILVENVWNQFCYDHEGGSDQTADKFAAYIDAFRSPWVAMQFDIGNHWKYGSMGDWIRTLGHRVLKLDVKGFSRAQDKWTAIGEGDIDFDDVRSALLEINFHGWCAAEVGGGNAEELALIASQMDRVFGLAEG